jgi:2-methylcitrate dehydratase PrpD
MLRGISRRCCVDDGGLFRYFSGEALVDKIVQAVPIAFIQTLSTLEREVGAVIVLRGAAAGAGASGLTALDRAIPRMRGTRGCG